MLLKALQCASRRCCSGRRRKPAVAPPSPRRRSREANQALTVRARLRLGEGTHGALTPGSGARLFDRHGAHVGIDVRMVWSLSLSDPGFDPETARGAR